jgi:hypothetical protein
MAKTAKSVNLSTSALKRIEALTNTNRALELQKGISKDALSINDDMSKLDTSISDLISKSYSTIMGASNVDPSALEINQILHISQNKKLSMKKLNSTKDYKKNLDEFKKSIVSKNGLIDIINDRKRQKGALYASYDLILSIIPKMRLAINTMATSIISPDDFSKKTLGFKIKTDTSITAEENKQVTDYITEILKKYEIEDNIKDDVIDYLVKSEKAFAIISMNSEIVQMLKENESLNISNFLDMGSILKESVNDTSIISSMNEGFSLLFKNDFKDENVFRESVTSFISESVVIGSSHTFISESNEMLDQFKSSVIIQNLNRQSNSDMNLDDLSFKNDSIMLKRLNPENLVKLDIDGKILGYLYLDTYENTSFNADISSKSTNNAATNIGTADTLTNSIYSSSDIIDFGNNLTGNNTQQNPKIKFIADTFVNMLSVKDNLKLIRKSDSLRQAVYYTLLSKRISRQNKMRITYFTPDEVTHIDRKVSVFDSILFFAKLYIATLLTLLMQNIVRGADSRAYYVEVGLENDAANTIQSVIRDIKSKDIANIYNMDITSMLNTMGSFNDYYIPTIDGEKPIEISTVDGLSNVSLDNDFLNWLQSNIYSSLGVPSAYLNDVDNVEFAKALAQQNSRFVRDVVEEQRILGLGYTDLIRKIILKEKRLDIKVDVEKIELNFQPPFSLNMQNVTDQVSNLQSLLDAISDSLPFDPSMKDTSLPKFKLEMFKKYIPNIDWEDLTNIIEMIERDNIKPAVDTSDQSKVVDTTDGS